MQKLYESLNDDLEKNLPEMVAKTYDRLMKTIQDIREKVMKPIDDILDHIARFKEKLHEYEMSTVMNTEFFMQ